GGDGEDLLARRQAGGDEPAVLPEMVLATADRAADRAGRERLAHERAHLGYLHLGRGAIRGSVAHHVLADGGVAHVAGHIDSARPLQPVQVVAETAPGPVDTGLERPPGDRLDADEDADNAIAVLGLAGGEGERA